MTNKTDAWMPLWIGAYLADTMRLTTIQHGAYLLLLMAYWRDRSPLPDIDDELRSITKTDKSEWKAMRPVLAKFFRVEDGVWWHKRVEQEIADAEERSKKASDKAAKAALARWGATTKESSSNAQSNAPSIPQAVLEEVHDECPTPSPISSSLRSEEAAAKPRLPRTKSRKVTLRQYLDQCKAEGTKPIPDDHPIRPYARDAGITDEMLQVTWTVFKENYLNSPDRTKVYVDWAHTFANAVKGCWQRIWITKPDGSVEWSSIGLQQKNAIEARLAREDKHAHA